VLHTDDAAAAYRLAVLGDIRGAVNIGTQQAVDMPLVAEVLGARVVRLPVATLRAPLVAAWRLHLTPASPDLFDAVLRLPLMDTTRARAELGWTPRYDARATVAALLDGLREKAGGPTPPLARSVPGGRLHEVRTGAGSRP
jgi:nucleoside-diphosphate-sugar epimerase